MALSAPQPRPAPAYLRPRLVGLVVLGGTLGTALRDRLAAWWPARVGELPWTTLLVNLSGAFLLGALLQLVVLVPRDGGQRRAVQLTLGTGVLGGYTTYSTFALETATLGLEGSGLMAAGYALVTVLGGFLAAWSAMRLVRGSITAAGRDLA